MLAISDGWSCVIFVVGALLFCLVHELIGGGGRIIGGGDGGGCGCGGGG